MEYLKEFVDEGKSKQIFDYIRFHSIDKKTNNNAFKMQFDHLYKSVEDDFLIEEEDREILDEDN